jgi:hypothetical protein
MHQRRNDDVALLALTVFEKHHLGDAFLLLNTREPYT